ncbi:MAG TPA: ATP-binding protein [Candidatus Methanoperedens sp.]|nr:ATP-binding protein [Candidatus Methanoperedens sp.]
MGRAPFIFTLRFKLVAMMLLLSLGLVAALVLLYYQSEKVLYNEFERRTAELSRAIQFGLEEVSGAGPPDEKRLEAYLKRLNPKGVREISIINTTDRIVASTDPKNVGNYITKSKKEMIFQAELGQPMKTEGQVYNVTLPVVSQGKQLGYVNLRMGAEDFDLFLQTSMQRRIAAALVVFALGTVVAVWLAGRYTAPVERVVRAAGAVAAGDLTVELPVDRRDEIGALAQSFNAMVGRLREERDLRERLRKAEHLAGIGQFSQSIAHEIRNPLNFISLSIDHLREAHAPAAAAAAAEFVALCENMKKEIQRVSRFAQSFLEFGRPLELNRRPVAIGPLIDGVLSLVTAKAEHERVVIVRELAALPELELEIDPDFIRTCLYNLVLNAFQAMPGGGTLTIGTREERGQLALVVADTGTGIPKEKLAKVFDPFFTTKTEGLGLGLALIKRVIEEHGGRVGIESEEGRGSAVTLYLPLVPGTGERA